MSTAQPSPPGGSDPAQTLPVLPSKNTVLFPYVFAPLVVGRPQSVAAVEAALATEEKVLIVVAQKNAEVEHPGADDLYTIGAKAVIKRMAREPEQLQIIVQGTGRVAIERIERVDPFLVGNVRDFEVVDDSSTETEALRRSLLDLVQRMVELAQAEHGMQVSQLLSAAQTTMHLVYMLGSLLQIDVAKEQALLEANTQSEALRLVYEYLEHEVQVQELRHQITSKAKTEMNKEQREYMLRQQLKTIQEELGEISPEEAEVDDLRKQLEDAELPDDVRKEAERELKRLERLPTAAPDYQLTRTYLELLTELPWNVASESSIDLVRARRVLDEDHFGLKEVKDRIIEHLAVLLLNPQAHSPILCFVGPPGVGKTSLGQSIARAIGRNFERLSLGGLHDESELRGHRRTYIGAMPGRIIQAIRRAGVNNPLLMLDEVDKLGRDFRGDPSSALLEILDPAQNHTFHDNYLNLPFDLSKVFFITTANTTDTIPRPLLDRMETLRIPGYTEEEKMEIARRYLIPRQMHEGGLSAGQLAIADETLKQIISRYTREAGVRQLERAVGRLTRKVAVRVAEGRAEHVAINPDDLPEMLGHESRRPEQARQELEAGVAAGLAWTEAGGEILYVEATLLPDGRGLRLTGQLGDVMRESAEAALSYVWSHAERLGIDQKLFRKSGVHVHVPAGAVPKDGPSAGVAMVTALASMFTETPARGDTAMTGEITLSGHVLPIGGVREKVLAARAAGMRRVILPKANEPDLRDLADEVRAEMEFITAERIEDVLTAAIPGLESRLTAMSPT